MEKLKIKPKPNAKEILDMLNEKKATTVNRYFILMFTLDQPKSQDYEAIYEKLNGLGFKKTPSQWEQQTTLVKTIQSDSSEGTRNIYNEYVVKIKKVFKEHYQETRHHVEFMTIYAFDFTPYSTKS